MARVLLPSYFFNQLKYCNIKHSSYFFVKCSDSLPISRLSYVHQCHNLSSVAPNMLSNLTKPTLKSLNLNNLLPRQLGANLVLNRQTSALVSSTSSSSLTSGILQRSWGISSTAGGGGGGSTAAALVPVAHDSGSLYEFGPMLVTLWTVILGGNLIGLAGYSIGPTVHLAVVFPTALALWGSIILSSIQYRPSEFLAHLVPPGSPLVLAPFLCVIEAASILIRPITLSVRLVANLSAGHLILGLIGGGVVAGGMMTQITSLGVSTVYTGFEVFVACIQTYIFCNLVSLYSEEHS